MVSTSASWSSSNGRGSSSEIDRGIYLIVYSVGVGDQPPRSVVSDHELRDLIGISRSLRSLTELLPPAAGDGAIDRRHSAQTSLARQDGRSYKRLTGSTSATAPRSNRSPGAAGES